MINPLSMPAGARPYGRAHLVRIGIHRLPTRGGLKAPHADGAPIIQTVKFLLNAIVANAIAVAALTKARSTIVADHMTAGGAMDPSVARASTFAAIFAFAGRTF